MNDAKKAVIFGELQAWEDVVICTEAPEETTSEGIVIPMGGADNDPKKKPEKGIVAVVGPMSKEAPKLLQNLKPGDLIFYERYTANRINDGTIEYNFVRIRYIMGYKKAA